MATLDNNKNCLEFAKIYAPPGGLEPPTFRLTAERASQLRHGGFVQGSGQINAEANAVPLWSSG